MNYIYYRVLDNDDKLVFQWISHSDSSVYYKAFYEGSHWNLKYLMSCFIDKGYIIHEVEFTGEELNDWLLNRGVIRGNIEMLKELNKSNV